MNRLRKLIIDYQDRLFLVFDVALNGVNYFFHIFCSWYLSQGSYGTLNSILSLASILLVIGIAFQVYTAKEVARGKGNLHLIYQGALSYIVVVMLGYVLGIDVLIKVIGSSGGSLIIVIAIFILNVLLSIIRGVFQGKQEFIKLNISFYIEVLSKIVFLVVMLPRYEGINIILISILFGMSMSILHGGYALSVKSVGIKPSGSIVPTLRSVAVIFISNFFIYYFTSIDIIIVNYYYKEISGAYSVVIRYSQIILFVSFSMITIFLPKLSSAIEDREEFKSKATKYFGVLIGVQVLLLLAYLKVIPSTVTLLFGSEYAKASSYLFKGAIMYCLLVNNFYIVNLNIVLEKKGYIYILAIGALILTTLLVRYSRSIDGVILIGCVSYLSMFLALLCELGVKRGSYEQIRKRQ